MGDIALVTVIGNLTKDATATPLDNDPSRLKIQFSLASSYYQRGQDQRPKAFYNVTMWMNQSRWGSVSQFFRQGSQLCVWGELRPRTGQDGKTWLNVDQAQFTFVGGRDNQQGGGQPQAAQPPAQPYGQPAAAAPAAPAQPPAAPAAPPQQRYITNPQYPGWYQDTSTGQWYEGQPPDATPPAGPPPASPPPGGAPPGTPTGGPPA